jgi:HEAT repeat protein
MTGRHLNETVARQRRAALAGYGGDIATARELLQDVDANVRATALGALRRLDALTKEDLLDASSDPDPIVRRRACTESTTWNGSVGDPIDAEVASAVALLLDDDDISVVEIAAWACGERPPASHATIARLSEIATTHDDALCRESAVAALGALGDPSGLPAILSATTDKATVRRRAVIALAPFEGAEVDAAIELATTDRDWQVRQAAEDLSP